ncbi:MAG TPA: FG-GAP-like repeat-containing protein [Candidatus Sulfotelmatobacter sp.]
MEDGSLKDKFGGDDKPRRDGLFVDRGRREFLIRFCQGASVAMLPAGLPNLAFRLGDPRLDTSSSTVAAPGAYHLHPHYRTQRPLDALLLKAKAGSDEFVTEKYHSQIATTLAEWSAGLRSSAAVGAFERALAPGFSGLSINPDESKLVRTGAALEVRQMVFRDPIAIAKDKFLGELPSALSGFAEILTADFQITRIETGSSSVAPSAIPQLVKTRIRFELVGTGKDFYREQRVGRWDIEWENSFGQFLIRSWNPVDETRSRSSAPIYADITEPSLDGNPSYREQIVHGTDYWRTVLDGACGINIYGHNGVSVADIDGDGFDDLYICQPAGLPNRLYRNRGDSTFEDITEASGVGILDETACALFADFDNDGRQDLIVVRASGPLLFVNEGNGRFRQKPDAFQFTNSPQGAFTGAAVADYDRDGWLDVYFCLYVYYRGADQYKYPLPYYAAENGPPNFLMRNQRDGTFRDVTQESGLNQNNTRYSFCCGWGDYNGDGWPDLYVVNDFGRKNLYRNNGDGTFTDVAPQEGVEDIGAGMSVCWLDYDNDGAQDIYVADMWTAAGERISIQDVFKKGSSEEIRALYRKHAMGNSLFRNRGHLGSRDFEDKTESTGVGMGRWAWSSDSWDFDHDGFPDLYIANGMISGPSREDLNSFFWRQVVARSPDGAKGSHEYEEGWNAINELIRADSTWSGFERNVFYANNRNETFSDVSGAVGLDFLEDGRAFALADFDGDGRQEIFLKNRNGPQLRVLKNVMEHLPPSIAFHLRGIKSNRDGIGASITLETSSCRQARMLQAGSGFLSQHSKQICFGLGESTGPVKASIRWPSGLVQQLEGLLPNHMVWVEEGREATHMEAFKVSAQRPVAAAVSPARSQHVHEEELPNVIQTWLLAPIAAPDFSLSDFSGRDWTLTVLRGEIVLLYFWSPKASGWQETLTSLEQQSRRSTAQLLVVNVDSGEDIGVQAWIRGRHISFPILRGTEDIAAIYNILYRYTFDRHRDMPLPTAFLIDGNGDVVKVYQRSIDFTHVELDIIDIPGTAAQRIAKALPFSGLSSFEFARNNLSYGSAFFQRGYMEPAAAAFQQALKDDPSSAEALYGLGSAYLNQQKTAEAKESFEGATKLHSSYPDTLPNAWNNLGLLAARESKTAEAIAYFQKALELNPTLFVALENLGNAYRQQKRWNEARDTLEKALSINADDAEANYSLGMVYAQTNDTEHAYEYLRKTLELQPAYPEALNNLGILYLRTQRRDEAVASFEECIRTSPDFDQSYLNLAQVYALENQPAKAREILLELLKRHPDNAHAQQAMEQLSH